MQTIRMMALAVLAACAVACAAANTGSAPAMEWRAASPESQGVDPEILRGLPRYLEERQPHVRSMLMVRGDRIVFEHYRAGVSAGDLHEVNSVTKSVVSALIGIAIANRKLQGIDQKIADLLPEASAQGLDPKVGELTLKHLLTMTSGFAESESGSSIAKWRVTEKHADYTLSRPFLYPPGAVFNYDNFSSHLLSIILARASGMSTAQFAERHLFGPLGITDYRWNTDRQGYQAGSHGLRLTARDMAKLGRLFLHRGVWEGTQVVPSDYAQASTSKQTRGGAPWPPEADYGYLWWIWKTPDNQPVYVANGYGGQYIYVAPHLDLIVVITSNPTTPNPGTGAIIREFVIPAVLKK